MLFFLPPTNNNNKNNKNDSPCRGKQKRKNWDEGTRKGEKKEEQRSFSHSSDVVYGHRREGRKRGKTGKGGRIRPSPG
jgi:hypothetical protein